MGLIQDNDTYLMNTYARFPVVVVKGEGTRLWDADGKEYVDFLAGLAVCNLGHCHPSVNSAVREQMEKLGHVSNFFHIGPQIELARKLTELSFADRAFFCNSGTEANEAALKLARRWAKNNRNGAFEIITTEGSFHGRTAFSLSVTGQPKFHAGFEPLVPGVVSVPYDDPSAVDEAVNERTAAVIVEPIQGEGGVRVPSDDYLRSLREICDLNGILLILDEVQTGMGRTGSLFAYQDSGIEPDVITLAKALGNGFPIGAVLAVEKVAAAFGPGSHGATFGGNFLACAAGLAVVNEMSAPGFMEKTRETGDYFRKQLEETSARHDCVMEVRGRGLHLAMVLDRAGKEVVNYCLDQGMIINCTADTVLRFVPPLNVTGQEIDLLIPVLDQALSDLEERDRAAP